MNQNRLLCSFQKFTKTYAFYFYLYLEYVQQLRWHDYTPRQLASVKTNNVAEAVIQRKGPCSGDYFNKAPEMQNFSPIH